VASEYDSEHHGPGLLKRPEGKTLEFKREFSGRDGLLKTVVAFANTAGGTLLVGVEDRTGHVRVPDGRMQRRSPDSKQQLRRA
jgi:predicted HTH transcriptional regulator